MDKARTQQYLYLHSKRKSSRLLVNHLEPPKRSNENGHQLSITLSAS